jgi:hypothetical protein
MNSEFQLEKIKRDNLVFQSSTVAGGLSLLWWCSTILFSVSCSVLSVDICICSNSTVSDGLSLPEGHVVTHVLALLLLCTYTCLCLYLLLRRLPWFENCLHCTAIVDISRMTILPHIATKIIIAAMPTPWADGRSSLALVLLLSNLFCLISCPICSNSCFYVLLVQWCNIALYNVMIHYSNMTYFITHINNVVTSDILFFTHA